MIASNCMDKLTSIVKVVFGGMNMNFHTRSENFCVFCDGSGEGIRPDSRCWHCAGTGMEGRSIDPDDFWEED